MPSGLGRRQTRSLAIASSGAPGAWQRTFTSLSLAYARRLRVYAWAAFDAACTRQSSTMFSQVHVASNLAIAHIYQAS